MAVFQFIEGWYNPGRRHSALSYMSPINYERSTREPLKLCKPITVHETGETPKLWASNQ